jgi:hypothetical protein
MYEVEFTIETDISSWPWTCSVGNGANVGAPSYSIGCVQRGGDPGSLHVEILDDTGTNVDAPFTNVVYCRLLG